MNSRNAFYGRPARVAATRQQAGILDFAGAMEYIRKGIQF
jgi:hypothetical protein